MPGKTGKSVRRTKGLRLKRTQQGTQPHSMRRPQNALSVSVLRQTAPKPPDIQQARFIYNILNESKFAFTQVKKPHGGNARVQYSQCSKKDGSKAIPLESPSKNNTPDRSESEGVITDQGPSSVSTEQEASSDNDDDTAEQGPLSNPTS